MTEQRLRTCIAIATTIACLIFLLIPAMAIGQPVNPTDSVSRIRAAMNRREFTQAQTLLENSLKASPGNIELRLARADLLARTHNLKEALDEIGALRKLEPKNTLYQLREAQFLSWYGRFRSSAEAYSAILSEHPNDADARTGLGLTLFWRGDWQGANDAFDEVLRADKLNSIAFLTRLKVLIAQGRPSDAWRDGRARDMETGEKDPELGLVLASIAAGVGADDVFFALVSRPTDDDDLLRRQTAAQARRYVNAGDPQKGVALMEKFVSTRADNYDALVDLADVYAAADRLPLARERYEQANRLTPSRSEARRGLARLTSREARLSGSLEMYRQLVSENPEDIEGWLSVARTLQLLDRAEQSRESLVNAARVSANSANVLEARLVLEAQAGNVGEIDKVIQSYAEHQMLDRKALLWNQRWRAARGMPYQTDLIGTALDPLAPAQCALGISLIARSQRAGGNPLSPALPPRGGEPKKVEPDSIRAPDARLQKFADSVTAKHLALLLEKDAAIRYANNAGEVPDAQLVPMLVDGWLAYEATPFAGATGKPTRAAGNSMGATVWRALEVQRRLRLMYVEADGPLFEDWLLHRAVWYDTWKSKWNSPESLRALDKSIVEIVPGANNVGVANVREAWTASERTNSQTQISFPFRIGIARWRQYRFEFHGALDKLEELEHEQADALEPRWRHASLLRTMGRWQDAAERYRRLVEIPGISPTVRLEYADLLARLGEFDNARAQLDILEAAHMNEPELFLARAQLAELEWKRKEVEQWVAKGIAAFPDSSALREFEARYLQRHGPRKRIAELIGTGKVPSWIDYELLEDGRPELSHEQIGAITNSPAWWLSWHWLASEEIRSHAAPLTKNSSDEFGLGGGYEFSHLQGASPDWHEWFFDGYWRHGDKQTFSFDLHRFDRFGTTATQLNLGLSRGWMHDWMLRVYGGDALTGNFIPEWHIGGGATYRWSERIYTHLDLHELSFSDVSVFQVIPGLTWHWLPRWESGAKVYIAENKIKNGASEETLTWALSTSWQADRHNWLQLNYSFGSENSANLVRNFVGEQGFQSVGLLWRYDFAGHWALQPAYRFEHHQRFDIHALGVALHYRF